MARDTTTTTARSPRRAARPGRLAAVAILLGCQALPPGASSPTADGFYRDAGRGHRYPRPEAEILQAVEREDLPTLRRHGRDLWAALTQAGRDGFPAFLTWYQVSEVFGEAATASRQFRPEFQAPSQKSLGDGDAILTFNVYNRTFRDHVRAHGYQFRAVLQGLVG